MKLFPKVINEDGYTLPEALVYIAVLVVLAAVSIGSLITLTRTYIELSTAHAINQSATAVLDRLVREIRFASSIDTGASTLGSSPGHLVLNTTDSAGDPTTMEFYISGGTLVVSEGGGETSPIIRETVDVPLIIFNRYVGAGGWEAVQFSVTMTSQRANANRSETFEGGAVLRGGY
jgi:type II secretory pathway pseudopilin PulG